MMIELFTKRIIDYTMLDLITFILIMFAVMVMWAVLKVWIIGSKRRKK